MYNVVGGRDRSVRWWGPVHALVLVIAGAAVGTVWLYGQAAAEPGAIGAIAGANADAIVRLERTLGLDGISALSQGGLGRGLWADASAAVYSLAYWPFLGLGLVVVWQADRRTFLRLGLAVATSGLVGVAVMTLFPVAPPRLAGFADIVAGSPWGSVAHPDAVLNPYGAMPSFHVGWSLLAAAGIASVTKRRVVWLQPVLMSAAVVLTANHWALDVVAGAALAAAAWWTAPALLRFIERQWAEGQVQSSST